MLNIVLLAAGLVVILLSAGWLVDGASSVAKKLGISDIVIGLTVVSLGTSAPELTVNIFSAVQGATDIAIGNVLGSNISNIFLIAGLAAVVNPITINENTKWKEIPFSLLAIVVLGIMANDLIFNHSATRNYISRADGLILLCFMAIFLVYTFAIARGGFVNNSVESHSDEKVMGTLKAVFLIVIGLIGLFFGGKMVVDSAVTIARIFGMTEKVIGVTIIAIGTSVPELATSVVASYRKKTDMAIGNVVGSNIFNVFLILGITSLIKPLPFNISINIDILVASLASILLFMTTITFGLKKIGRGEGAVFVTIYIVYITYQLLSN